MSLSKSYLDDMPKDAVVISENQALRYQWKIISEWESKSEVWALNHSSTVGAIMSSLTGIFVNTHYRRKLRLGSYGHMSTYLPIVIVPAIFTILTHKFLVQRSIVLDPMGQCPVCLQVRSAGLQIGCGLVYPTILAPIAAFMFATRHFTYRLPSITENPKEVLQLWRKMTRPILPTLSAILAGQALISMYLAYKQQQQSANLIFSMQKIERRLEEEAANAKLHRDTFE